MLEELKNKILEEMDAAFLSYQSRGRDTRDLEGLQQLAKIYAILNTSPIDNTNDYRIKGAL